LSEEITLSPITREEIHKLEAALLIGTLFRPDVLDTLKKLEERLTWVDSLAVAAATLAREKAKMTVSKIAEELGRSEATIRSHLTGKTKAGQLVKETFERFSKEGVKLEFIPIEPTLTEEVKNLRKELENEKMQKQELEQKIQQVKKLLNELLRILG